MAAEPWKRVEPTILTKIDYHHVVIKTFEVPQTNNKKTFAVWLNEDARYAGVIALTKDKQVIVAQQFRQGPEKMFDDLPGGDVEAGEDPEDGARRELLEETGYVAGHMEFLGTCSRDAYMNGQWNYFLATDCELSSEGQHLDEHELVEVKLISIAELIDNAKHDKMLDPVAVLMAYEKLKQLMEG